MGGDRGLWSYIMAVFFFFLISGDFIIRWLVLHFGGRWDGCLRVGGRGPRGEGYCGVSEGLGKGSWDGAVKGEL